MANPRELSQVGGLVTVNDSTGQVGIANSVGINTSAPTGSYAMDVHGVINSTTYVQIGGVAVLPGGVSDDDATALAIALG